METLSKHDADLISEAKNTDCINWPYVSDMVAKAESQTAKNIIKDIAVRLYHKEEAGAGLL